MTSPANLDDVFGVIEGCFEEQTFSLNNDAFGAGEIQNVIKAYLEDSVLVLTDASYQTQTDRIVVTGFGSNQPFGNTLINVAFGFDDVRGVATMNLLATAQAEWTLGVSFPSVAHTFLPELEFSAQPLLYLASYDSERTRYGLYFQGDLILTGLLAQLNWLLGNTNSLQVRGLIEMHQGIPEMNLQADEIIGDIALGYFNIPGVNFNITSNLVTYDHATVSANAYMYFSTSIRFQTDNTQVNIPVSAVFFNRPTYLQFRADLNEAVFATLNELSTLMAGADLTALLGGVDLSDYVGLTNFVLQVNPSTQSLMSVSMGVHTVQPLTLISDGGFGNVITVNNVELGFQARPPFDNPALSMALFGSVQVFDNAILDISALYPDFIFDAELQPGTNLNLVQVVQYFVQSIDPEALADVPAIDVTEFALTVQPSTPYYKGLVAVDNHWPITLGPTTLLISDVLFSILYNDGDVEAEIAGKLVIGDDLATVEVDWQMPGDLLIQGTVPSIALSALIDTYTSQALGYSLPVIVLENTHLLIERFQDGGYLLAFGTSVTDFGTMELEFAETNTETGATVGFMLPPDWRLTDLSNDFNIWILKDLTFTSASLVISSFDNPYFSFRSADNLPILPAYADNGIAAGMYLYADLTLTPDANTAFGTVSNLLAGNEAEGQEGTDSLKVSLAIPYEYSNTEFTALLAGGFTFIKTSAGTPVVVLDDLGMIVQPFHEYIDLYLDVSLYIWDAHLGLRGDLIVDGPELDIKLETTTSWSEPFGIKGLTLGNMAAEFRFGDTIALGLEGEVVLGTGDSVVTLVAAMEFNIEADFVPDVFYISESGSINFGHIIETFVGSHYTPPLLKAITLYEFSFIIIANPAGWTDLLTGKHYGAGIGFSGMVNVYGLVAEFAIEVDYSNGIYAHGQLSEPVYLGPTHNHESAVVLANASHPEQGPYLSINSSSSPDVSMSVALKVWELSTIQLAATVENDAFILRFNASLSSVEAFGELAIIATLENGNHFTFDALVTIDVSDIGPIKVGHRNLGTLHPQIRLDAGFNLDFGPGNRLRLSINADFNLSSYNMALPGTSISVSGGDLSSFAEIPDIFKDTLADNLWDIGAELFQDAGELFDYVEDRFFELSDDIGDILKNDLNIALNDATVLLKSVSHVMAYDIEEVSRYLKLAYNAVDKDLTKALKYAEYEIEDVAETIGVLYHKSAESVAKVLKKARYDYDEISRALKNTFGYSAKEVAKFLKHEWDVADHVVHDALRFARYEEDKIGKAMKKYFGWVSTGVHAVGHALDPHNW